MGWLALAVLAAVALLILWRSRVSRALWPAVGAALALGAAGYAVQNRATLPASPVAADTTPMPVPEEEIALRDAMLGRYSQDWSYLVASDGLFRGGRVESGTRVLLTGLSHYPRSLTMWTGLGNALARHDGEVVSPAAKLAFARAAQINPLHPAPPFFEGLAYARSGDLITARAYWARALALTPRDISYRGEVAERLALLDRYLAFLRTQPPR